MPDIFISYSRDDRERVRYIANALEAAGHDVWWDPEIPPGESFANVIDQNLKNAACIIVAWSKSSVNSNWVQEEADDGMMRKTLIPVMIDEIDLPRGFKRLQTADLRGWAGDLEDPNWQLVFAQVQKLVAARQASEAAEEQAAARERAAQAQRQTAARQPAQAAQQKKPATPQQRKAAAPPQQERSGGLPIIPIIAGLFVIGAGSFGYYFMAKSGDDASTQTVAAQDPVNEAANDGAEAGEDLAVAGAHAEQTADTTDADAEAAEVAAIETAGVESTDTILAEASLDPEAMESDAAATDAEAAQPVTEETQPVRAAGEKFRDCNDCPEVVVVASTDSFTFGADGSRDRAEAPEVQVTIGAPFAIGVYEITYDDWQVCLDDGGCNEYEPPDMGWGAGQRPVVNVSHEDANAYLNWLSEKTGQTYRLPSEAEWEYAAQAGSDEEFSTGNDITASQANINGDFPFGGGPKELNRGRTVEVGSFAANPYGLFDVHGNVWEWVADCWKPSHAGAPSDASAVGGACSSRVIKGGAFTAGAWRSRARHRRSEPQSRRDFDTGFRVLREL